MIVGGIPGQIDFELWSIHDTPCVDDVAEHRGQGSNIPDHQQDSLIIDIMIRIGHESCTVAYDGCDLGHTGHTVFIRQIARRCFRIHEIVTFWPHFSMAHGTFFLPLVLEIGAKGRVSAWCRFLIPAAFDPHPRQYPTWRQS
jgi:hypothetical protein